ncbi:MAG: NADP-dependent oxidoreductase [Lactobacillus sp.]|jgi:NADPH:quinone reductase-like Zn-dependent oxidoreductase|nr:NADP-dependent oxidoreductase [Lactobacillus sp.]MCI2033754.1 NADP-dependent oxidoreductase [Lactobacillus sp.]
MQRFGFDQFGGPEVFTTLTAEQPIPKPNQVQLRVLGFGLNPYDASLRRGEQAAFRPLPFPIVPGTDIVGQITSVGAEVDDFQVGDIVLNYRPLGGYSDFVTASATKLIHKPTTLSFATAAALPQVGIAAYTVMTMLEAHPGQSVTILGAGGGIGNVLVQLAKARGLIVRAVASAKHHDWLQQRGADSVSTYTGSLAPSDFVVDAINGGGDLTRLGQLVRPGGTVVTTAYVTLPDGPFTHQQLTKMAPTPAAFNALMTLAQTSGLALQVTQKLPFSTAGVQRGHTLLDDGHRGKFVVLQPKSVLDAAEAANMAG